MGGSSWSEKSYSEYACSVGRSYNSTTCTFNDTYSSSSQAFKMRYLNEALDPKNVIRECCDSDEHPNTIPVILALDVTGSMGDTAIRIQKQLNPIMKELYETVKDVEIAIMAIGDLNYDSAPIQISQFESDIRIADNLDKIYFENGGGGNGWESYTAAWWAGLNQTKLDCWKRGKKGIIITMGDEPINPYLPRRELNRTVGSTLESDVDTDKLYREVIEKFDVYHICVQSGSYPNQDRQAESFRKVMNGQNVMISNIDEIQSKIVKIIQNHGNFAEPVLITDSAKNVKTDENGDICW